MSKKIILNGKKKTVDTCRRHFEKRWYQRVSNKQSCMFDTINKAIKNEIPKSEEYIKFLWKESNTRSHYRIKVEEKYFIVVYNKNLGCVTTVFEEPDGQFYKGNSECLHFSD